MSFAVYLFNQINQDCVDFDQTVTPQLGEAAEAQRKAEKLNRNLGISYYFIETSILSGGERVICFKNLWEVCAGAIPVPAPVKLGEMSVKAVCGGLGKGVIVEGV